MNKNCEEVIKHLMHEEKMRTQKDLLREIYKKINNREFESPDPECEEWVKKNESNFSSMKKGERGFPLEFKYALSEISGKSFSEFLKGKKEEKEDDAYFGIRYAVCKDQEKFYRKLLEPRNEDGELWIEGIEYDKDILECVVEHKKVKGLKFLLNVGKHYVHWHIGLKNELLSWAIELDDMQIFKELMGKLWMQEYVEKDVFYNCNREQIYNMILKSKNILEIFSTPVKVENDFYDCGRLPYVFGFLLSHAIKNKETETVDKLFSIYEKHVQNQIKDFLESEGFAQQKAVFCSDDSYRGHFTYLYKIDPSKVIYLHAAEDSSKKIILINFERIEDSENKKTFEYLSERYNERFAALLPEEVKKSICKGPQSLSDGEEYIDRINRKIYRRREPCQGYAMMKLMTYDNSVAHIVRFYGNESKNGVLVSELERDDEEYFYSENRNNREFSALIPIFSEIHRISEQELGKGQVYSYKDYGKIVRLNREGGVVLGGWVDNTRICSPEEVLIDLTLSHIRKLGYARKSREVISEIKEAFSKYYDKSHVENFGDRLSEELQRRIGKLDKKIEVEKYERLMHAQIFVNLYIDELNALGDPS